MSKMIQTEPAYKICDKGIYKKVNEKLFFSFFQFSDLDYLAFGPKIEFRALGRRKTG